jgi:membrane-associated phospholipid phosphatase
MISALAVAVMLGSGPITHDAYGKEASREPIADQALDSRDGDKVESVRVVAEPVVAGLLVWFEAAANPPNCSWCDRDDSGRDTLNGFDRSIRARFVWAPSHRKRADTISTIFEWTLIGGGVAWALVPKLSGSESHRLAALSMVVDALAADAAMTGAFKRVAARERPWVHFGDASAASGNRNDSFLSGHTSHAFAMATSIGYVCHLFHCSHEKATWLIAMLAAGHTGYLRVAADKHYATDVLAGAGAGVASGLLAPLLSRRTWKLGQSRPSVTPMVTPRGAALRSTWTW